MHYTLKHLHYIEAAERHQSITAAAEGLAVSPSSIAAAIDHIEAQLGQPIFARVPSRGIAATSFGRKIIDEIRLLLAAQSRFDGKITDLEQRIDGTARIACFTPLAPILLPTILCEVRERYPNLAIEVIEGNWEELARAVDTGDADFAFCYGMANDMTYRFLPLFVAHPHAALPAVHPLASGRFVTLEQLAPEPLVVLDLDMSRRYLMELFSARGLKPNVVYSARSTDMMRALIAAGMCYGIFNIRPMSKQTYARGDLVRLPLAGEHDAPRAGVLTRRDVQLSPVCEAIIATCEMQAMRGEFDRAFVRPYLPQDF
ncbi:LysR family transcriptional regulator [Paracoccus kondratievae]|uniref:LysR family transcriptional regulator n=2 Tax=Paracoccaceae TaxID=31989 RepID=A0AAD3P225_9RHOB|nr:MULTISPECIES: LysR family transcriptional regulator [Paracoccus]QFQ88559.1 LysR family transcriptional regulator [Paracoccus kondratievae]GLK65704.1 LysR family transcriptional regulator [Paracoccus kondratievae]SMG50787.1 transcriptional regulator, LysR family [Paracoccus sp. J56]